MEVLRLLWDDGYLAYDFGDAHPMAPIRLELALHLMRDLGLLAAPGVTLARPEPDPDVLTISLHETGRVLFPGTGHPGDVGGGDAQGCAVNVAFPPGTGDAAWLRAFHAVVPPLVRAFGPDVLVTQHGCDSHVLDPLAHMALSLDAQRASYAALHDLAHEHAGGRWVAFGGGGYEA